ncbi:MAG: sulfatase-like hydrolase/transferase [Bacteroidetes bacterium]|nr:sulfatase-like hydrolase/transferase [Bacteroidota bacterium]
MKLKVIVLLILTQIIFASVIQAQQKATSPNVIIVLADDLGNADVGFNGCLDIPTPNIDRIAERGVVFTNGYVSYCVCGPSRAGLITGRYQDRFGFGRNPLFAPNDPGMGLPLSEETLADVLKKANYKSLAIGKWHLGAHETLHPLERGFDDFYGFLSGGHQYFPELLVLNDPFEAKAQFDGYKTKLLKNYDRVEETEYLTDAFSREAVSYIEKNKDNPFFIYLAYNAPHTPLQATEKYLSRFENIKEKKRKTYAAMVSAVDDGVGLVLAKLQELNLTENTIVVFLSDNGGPEKTNGSNNGVFRGQKGDVFEGGIRVPFAMQWPAKIPAGLVYDNPVISLDIFASVIAQTKTQVSTKNQLDGVNLIPYLSGKKEDAPHEYLFWRKFDAKDYAVRKGNDKMILKAGSEEMLFDLEQDISEEKNLSAKRKVQVNMLTGDLKKWESELLDPTFTGLMKDEEYNANHPERFKKQSK